MKLIPKMLAVTGLLSASFAANAHFQLIHTPEMLRDKGGKITLKMPFTHPAESGHVMDMAAPLSFSVVHKGKRTDLANTLKPIQWTSSANTGAAYEATVKLKGLGDFIYVLEPAPYYEESEDIYIQQITKTNINVGSLPTDWDAELGLETEIVPLNQPYAIYAGSTFSGVVKSSGKPVPFAEIEVEFMNFPPVDGKNAFAAKGLTTPPADAFITQSIRADANGTFTFGIPKAGMWGFAALGVGPKKSHEGKELSQDAVIWVQAKPMQ